MKAISTLACLFLLNFLYAEESDRHICYDSATTVTGFVDAAFYKEAVRLLPIVCVDIFVYDPQREAYLLVYRKNSPAKNTWWYPGGRLYKGESFFEAAKRKCWDEVQLKVSPVAQMSTYSTIFPDSEWNSPTHTINVAILAIKDADQIPQLDLHHQDYEWRSLQKSPAEDFYLCQIYKEAMKYISKSLRKD